MNNRIIGYEEAVKRLKDSERAMRVQKKVLRISTDAESQRAIQRAIFLNRREINLLLSIIAAEKKARKLWAETVLLRKENGKRQDQLIALEMMSGVSSTKRGPK